MGKTFGAPKEQPEFSGIDLSPEQKEEAQQLTDEIYAMTGKIIDKFGESERAWPMGSEYWIDFHEIPAEKSRKDGRRLPAARYLRVGRWMQHPSIRDEKLEISYVDYSLFESGGLHASYSTFDKDHNIENDTAPEVVFNDASQGGYKNVNEAFLDQLRLVHNRLQRFCVSKRIEVK